MIRVFGLMGLVAAFSCLEGTAIAESGEQSPSGGGSPDAQEVAAHPPSPRQDSSGVTEVEWSDFFKMPVGPRGLEFTEKLRDLDGKRVRLLGYMVRQGQPSPWKILLTPLPCSTHEREYGLAEDLPPQTVHVFVDRSSPPVVPFTPGPLLLTGVLSIGNRDEADGRVSSVRLQLDAPSPEDRRALNAAMRPKNGATTPVSARSGGAHPAGDLNRVASK
ncbi:MAG: hypothetical protein JNK85_04140 [Verrucomicrobiales bacterium]|nr:hypothetical protein [Verrucomicrobiales bacterium]